MTQGQYITAQRKFKNLTREKRAQIVGLQYILDTREKRIEGYGCFCYS